LVLKISATKSLGVRALVAAICLTGSQTQYAFVRAQAPEAGAPKAALFVPTEDYLKNFSYRVPRLSSGEDIYTLKNGKCTMPQNSWVELQKYALGDLNHDGLLDAAVTVDNSGGGSGVFSSLLVLLNTGSGLKQVDGVDLPLGDRDLIQNLSIEGGRVHIYKMVRRENESIAEQPTQKRHIDLGLRLLPELTASKQSPPDEAKEKALASYLANFRDKLKPYWTERFKQATMSVAEDPNANSTDGWRLAQSPGKVVIDFTWRTDKKVDPLHDMVLLEGSGARYIDHIASGALTDLASVEDIAPDTRDKPTALKLRAVFTCGQTEAEPPEVEVQSIREKPEGKNVNDAFINVATVDSHLALLSQNFAYAVTLSSEDASSTSAGSATKFYPLHNGHYRDSEITIDMQRIATGDLDHDGQADVAVDLHIARANGKAVDVIAVLINTPDGLSQVGHTNYIYDDTKKNFALQNLAIARNKMRVYWTADGKAEENMTDFELTPRLDTDAGYIEPPMDLKPLVKCLGKTIEAAWKNGESPALKQNGLKPLKLRMVFDADKSEPAQWLLMQSSGSTAFDQAALQSILDSSVRVREDSGEYSGMDPDFLSVDLDFYGGPAPYLECRPAPDLIY
jgi:hypothetical protein